jgi:hypothetical protein
MTNNIDMGPYQIDIYTDDYNDITDPDSVQFYLKVWLDDYYLDNPAGAIHWEPFRVKIESDHCLITSYTAGSLADLAYDVWYAQEDVSFSAWTQVGGCSYAQTCTAYWLTDDDVRTDLPPFITYSADYDFSIVTEDVSYVTDTYTTYTIELECVIDDTITYQP